IPAALEIPHARVVVVDRGYGRNDEVSPERRRNARASRVLVENRQRPEAPTLDRRVIEGERRPGSLGYFMNPESRIRGVTRTADAGDITAVISHHRIPGRGRTRCAQDQASAYDAPARLIDGAAT